MAFRNLSARISGDASSYVSATKRAERAASSFGSEATSLAGRLQILQGRADEAGDEIGAAGRKAATTTGLFSTLTLSTEGLALSFGSLSTVLSLSIIPALAALSTVLVPLAATAGVLGAALGGLGLGVIAGTAGAAALHTETLTKQLQSLASIVKTAVAPLADAFLPLLETLIIMTGEAVLETFDMIGGFVEFRDALLGVIGPLIEALPNALATLYDLGRSLLPVLQDLVNDAIAGAGPAFREMQATARQVVPILEDFGRALLDSLPQLNQLGLTILQETVPALLRLFRNVLTPQNIQRLIQFGRDMQPVITAFVDISTAVAGFISWASRLNQALNGWGVVAVFGGLATVLSGAGGVIALVSGLALAFDNLSTMIAQTKFDGVVDALKRIPGALIEDMRWFTSNLPDMIGRAASNAYTAFTDEFSGLGDFILKALGVGDEKQQALKAAVQKIGQNVGSWLTGAINNAVPNDFAFTLPTQTIDLGPLGKHKIGGDTIKFDIADSPLGGGSGGGGGGGGQSTAALAGGSYGRSASPRGLHISGELTTNEDGEIVAKIDERVDEGLQNEAQQSHLQ